MKLNFSLQSTRDNKKLDVNADSLKACKAQTQTLAIIANALGIEKPISTFNDKDGNAVYFVAFETCEQILQELAK